VARESNFRIHDVSDEVTDSKFKDLFKNNLSALPHKVWFYASFRTFSEIYSGFQTPEDG